MKTRANRRERRAIHDEGDTPIPMTYETSVELAKIWKVTAEDAGGGTPVLFIDPPGVERLMLLYASDFHKLTDGIHREALAV